MKQTAMTIAYPVGKNLYLNLTNRCPCACTFCIRTMGSSAYGSDPLWLEHEPSWEEVKAALDAVDVCSYEEVVFCGFGEPTERLELLCKTAAYLKEQGVRCIRLNTNGLSDLLHERKTAQDLHGLVDIVSISLNLQQIARTAFQPSCIALWIFCQRQNWMQHRHSLTDRGFRFGYENLSIKIRLVK